MSDDHKQGADASAAVPQRDILTTLEACADDPMWSAHAEVSKRTLLAAVSHIRAIRASLARVREALSLSPFDAVERAMSLASLMGGSIGMSNVEKTEAYKRQLRDHLIAYMYPPPAPAPTAPLPAAEEVDPWRPIETAPMDGTTVLLAAPERVTVGEWHAEQWPTASEYHGSTGEYLGQHETGECIPAAWYSWDGGFTDENPPTHWMPLPSAPTTLPLGEPKP